MDKTNLEVMQCEPPSDNLGSPSLVIEEEDLMDKLSSHGLDTDIGEGFSGW